MNIQLFSYLNSLAGEWPGLDALVVFIAKPLGLWVIVFVFGIMVLTKRGRSTSGLVFDNLKNFNFKKFIEIFYYFVPPAVSWFLVQFLKNLFSFPRPFEVLENVNLLFRHGSFDSFPSGHTAFLAALATSVYFYNKKFGFVLGFLALLIGLARIVAGVHFPVDILASYLIGILVVIIYNKFLVNIDR